MKTVKVYYTKPYEALVELEDKKYEHLSQEGVRVLNQEGVGISWEELAKILSDIGRQLEDDAEIYAVWDETDQTCLLEI